jgi:Putative zinc-finger
MDCETAKDLLSPYYDDELDPADRALVARHVENCSACARELESLAKLDRDSRLLYVPEPPLDIWERVESRLATPETTRSAIGRAFSRRQLMVAIGAVAASAVGVFVTSTMGRRDPKPVIPEVVHPAQHISIAPNAVLVDMPDMSPEDRHLIQLQKFCANDRCNEPLGASGEPVKVVLPNKTVIFVCSHECERWVRKHPKEAIAKAQSLEYGNLRQLRNGPGSLGPDR